MCEKHKPAYISNTTHLEITFYYSLSDKKIKSIVKTFPNIIHLDFKDSIGFSDKSLFVIAESYSNLRYINLWDAQITDKGLYAIVRSYYKLEYLNISYCRNISNKSLFEIAGNCHDLQEFYFAEACWITDRSISYILNSCLNLRKLDIVFSRGDIKDASTLMRRCFNIEYLDFSGVMALQNDVLIIAIIKQSLNLRYLEISHNNIGDEIIEALAYTYHKLEHLKLDSCSFLIRSIGVGRTAVVYEGIYNSNEVAIKVLKDAQFLQCFQLKVDVMQKLACLNSSTLLKILIFHFEEDSNSGDKGSTFIVLSPLCKQFRNWRKEDIQHIIGTLKKVHDMNIIHRDFRKWNLLRDQDGNVRIADWGFAVKLINQLLLLDLWKHCRMMHYRRSLMERKSHILLASS
ncbi:17418_t:CDS:2 [Funneliformis geosporum]|uniref:17418_t:CDS:1 n=1 Tax=Funneliformis geosporum TaxID=1117311 RepID=A0A9W4SJ73_9GLOM|nr:17418_t:CDS:2 [Funneliformis geosporum]